jgi:hypothetical protein
MEHIKFPTQYVYTFFTIPFLQSLTVSFLSECKKVLKLLVSYEYI